jgi:hypothetical protein
MGHFCLTIGSAAAEISAVPVAADHFVNGGEPMREFIVDLTNASTFDEFAAAFNEGFCRHCGGHTLWHGGWTAFSDFLSWPEEECFQLIFKGWNQNRRLQEIIRNMVHEALADNPHVKAIFA